jgi:mRNA interferase MazF
MALRAGSLVTVSFPFKDLTAVKRRPALVLIVHGKDLVVCGVTSKRSRRREAVALDEQGMIEGQLPRRSEIRPLKLFTIHRVLVHKVVGRVSDEIFDRVVGLLVAALRSGRAPRSLRPA